MLLSPRFAKDELFVFTSFDYLSVPKMYTQVGLKAGAILGFLSGTATLQRDHYCKR
jgi:hypothetical protein